MSFTGYYGMSNFGDDLFAQVCLAAARRYWPGVSPNLASSASPSLHGGLGTVGRGLRLLRSVSTVLSSDILVLGGGSTLASGSSRARRVQYALARWSRTRLGGVGISVGPFDGARDEAIAASVLRQFSFLMLRDRSSYEIACSMDLGFEPVMGGDLAALYEPDLSSLSFAVESDDRPVIGFAPANFATLSNPSSVRETAELHDALVDGISTCAAERGARVRILVLNAHPVRGDAALASAAARRLADASIETEIVSSGTLGVDATWHAIGTCTAVVSARLHGAVPAFLQSVPFLLYEYHRKCSDFVRDIGQPSELRIASQVSSERVSEQLNFVLSGTVPPAPCLSSAEYRARAIKGFQAAPWAN